MAKRKIPGVKVSPNPQVPEPLTREDTLDLTAAVQPTSDHDKADVKESAGSGGSQQPSPAQGAPSHTQQETAVGDPSLGNTQDNAKLIIKPSIKTIIVVAGAILAMVVLVLFLRGDYSNNNPTALQSAVSTESVVAANDQEIVNQSDKQADTASAELTVVDKAAVSVGVLELARAMQRSAPFYRQLQAVADVSAGLQDQEWISTLIAFVEDYAIEGVPSAGELQTLLPALQLEVEVFSGLEAPSTARRLLLSVWAIISDEANVKLMRWEKTKAIFSVTGSQLQENNLDGAIAALSHLEPAQKQVARGFVEVLKARVALDKTAEILQTYALDHLTN